jgi:hypothetical protein
MDSKWLMEKKMSLVYNLEKIFLNKESLGTSSGTAEHLELLLFGARWR